MDASFDQWRFYLSPQDTWDAMYQDCAAAKQSIEMEEYILHNDDVAQKFMRLFIQKAKQGLHIRILCDAVGSHSLRRSPLVAELCQAGGMFYFYHSLKLIDLLKPRRIFPRTHLKVLVVDSTVAYIGGACIAQRMKNWRDTQIRITGPVVTQIRQALDRNSREAVGRKAHKPRDPVGSFADTDADFAYLQNDPVFFRHPIYQLLLKEIDQATKFIYISTAFFVPTWRLRRSLQRAASRGVQTVILIPERSDSGLADWACLSYVAGLTKNGVRIFRYQPVVLHTKTAVIDGKWGTVGSCNFDSLSFFHNREANLNIRNIAALARMKQDFENDIDQSRELTRDVFMQIPLWKRTAAHLARLLHPIL